LRLILQGRSFQRFAWLGLALVSAGLAGTSQQLWERIVWILFALYSAFNVVNNRRE
jgi:hypothetical protein